MWDALYPYLAALLPTAGILVLFYVVMRNLLAADREERKAQADWQAAHASFDAEASSRNRNQRRVVRRDDASGATRAAPAAPSGAEKEGRALPAEPAGYSSAEQRRNDDDDTGHDKLM